MASNDVIAGMEPVTLAQFESLTTDGATKVMINTIRKYMPFFDRAVFATASDGTRDVGRVITSYPKGQARAYNEGWGTEYATGKQVAYETSMYRTRSVIDWDQYRHKGKKAAAWRLSQDQAMEMGMAREMVRRCFYGDNSDGRSMQGIANIVVPGETWKDQIISAGGTTDNKQGEIYIISWDQTDTHLTVPQNVSAPGLFIDVSNKPELVMDKNGKEFRGLVTEAGWDLGISLFNPRKVVRITNIDTTKLSANTKTGPNLISLLTKGMNRLDKMEGATSIYMNENMLSWLQLQIQEKSNVMYNQRNIGDRLVDVWGTTPIYMLGNDVLSDENKVLKID